MRKAYYATGKWRDCDTHKIECPQMGKLQEPCDGFKAKNRPEQRQTLFEVTMTVKYNNMFENTCFFAWANSAEEAIKTLDNAIGGGKSQELYIVKAKPAVMFGRGITRDANKRKEES